VLKNFSGDTAKLTANFSATNINVQGYASLSGNLTVTNNINLTGNARLVANGSSIILSGVISTINGDASNYVVTNGTGSLHIQNIGSGARSGNVIFPIGSSSYYNPVTLSNSGVADVFHARVQPGISNAYTGETLSGSNYTNGAVNATWFINEGTGGGSNATIELQWNAAQELSSFDRVQSRMGHYTGGAWQLGAAGNAGGSNPYTHTGSGYTSFSPFGVMNNNVILPVHQVNLNVIRKANGNRCQWNIVGDNIETVTLQRSDNGRDFTTIHSASSSLQGVFEDATVSRVLYYRLKVKALDGTVKFSSVVWIKRDDPNSIHVYPTAFQQSINVQNNSDHTATLKIYNSSGLLVLRQTLLQGSATVHTAALPSSAYFYHVESDGKTIASGRLIKQ
jgi:hypothetical protein